MERALVYAGAAAAAAAEEEMFAFLHLDSPIRAAYTCNSITCELSMSVSMTRSCQTNPTSRKKTTGEEREDVRWMEKKNTQSSMNSSDCHVSLPEAADVSPFYRNVKETKRSR
ncbi:hypothetical protein JOB18_017871 [Solea senegalensis]|uniref:Uncharacterized protein n=1 Tax=Solea senegalensis TaxID=28829 RepID=A0AAV6SQ03_SOLSE|nr:hypothetical protein JOB18_017871 [Solea senegalensis]